VQFYNSQNILIDSITIINSPMYELNPVLSQNLTIQNVIINSLGPNNDGCDPECCYDALINNCNFSTGDDCIAVKSGRNNDGRRVGVPSQYIVIQNCTMQNGHGGVTLGSECSGGINNVYAQYCNMSSPNLSSILRFKTNSVRGGIIENIFMRDCTIGQVAGDRM
jgi:polygalacturonase